MGKSMRKVAPVHLALLFAAPGHAQSLPDRAPIDVSASTAVKVTRTGKAVIESIVLESDGSTLNVRVAFSGQVSTNTAS